MKLLELIDICGVLCSTATHHTFCWGAHGIFIKLDHVLRHNISVNKCKRILIHIIFSDHSVIKLENSNQDSWILKNILLNSHWSKKKYFKKGKLKNTLNQIKREYNIPSLQDAAKSCPGRGS